MLFENYCARYIGHLATMVEPLRHLTIKMESNEPGHGSGY